MTVTLVNFLGTDLEESFLDFDLSEIQKVLQKLQNVDPIDLAHAELLQQQALRGADLIVEYLGKIVKTVSYLESQVNSVKNKVSLNYKDPDGSKTTADMKKWAGESSPEVEAILIKLAKAKAAKIVLEKKYDILIRSHHHYKDIAAGLRKSILGYVVSKEAEKVADGWE